MIQDSDYKVWISVEQRLDGLTGRWGPDAYLKVSVTQSNDEIVEFNISAALAKTLARGLNKAAKRAVSP